MSFSTLRVVKGLDSEIVLGMDWLSAYNPDIDWKLLTVKFDRDGQGPVTLSGVSPGAGSARV